MPDPDAPSTSALGVPRHEATAAKEMRGDNVRYRGRCSCGHKTYMHYGTPLAATNAIKRAHIAELPADERNSE